MSPSIGRALRDLHRESHPWCTYDGPHFVPPGFGTPGFYACEKDRPADQPAPSAQPGTERVTFPREFLDR